MAGWFYGDVIKVEKHLVVGKRQMTSGESDEYYARIWLRKSGKYKYVCLETRSETQAVEVLRKKQAFFEMREDEGVEVFRTSVSAKLEDFEHEYAQRSVSKQRIILVKNQLQRFKEYFEIRAVSSINNLEFRNYIEWRKKNNRRGSQYTVSNSALHSEVILMGSFVGYLANNRNITEGLFRSLKASGWSNFIGRKEVRGSLTVNQYKQLRDYTGEWHLVDKLDARAKYTRQIVHFLIRIAGHTGLRTIELKNLRWGDIAQHKKGCVLSVKGKGYARRERFRKILSDADTYEYLMGVRNLVSTRGHGVSASDRIFVKYDGQAANDLWAQNVRNALGRLEMSTDIEGRKISFYSLRHYFANRQIEAGVSIYDLAEYLGTSVSMVEQYYGKGTHEKLV